jgi:hypothetical protein
MKSYFHSLFPFLPLFCNCPFRRLDSIQFLCSQTHIPAGWRPETRLFTSDSATILSGSESYVTTDGQSASLSRNIAPIWGLRPEFYYCQTVADLLTWGALSDERTGLSFTIAAGPRQRSHSWVRVPWDTRPYFNSLRFETSLFVTSYDSQGYGGGISPSLHTDSYYILLKTPL